MKMVVVAGTPGSGKTSVLMHAVRELLRSGHKPALAKIDCMWTEDDIRFKRLNVPVAVGSPVICVLTITPSTMWTRCCSGPGPGCRHPAQ